MKKIIIIFILPIFLFSDYEYSLEDYNTTSPSYEMNVWNPEYTGYITMHFFSSQG